MSLHLWKPKNLFRLFNQDWESSQLKAVFETIDLSKDINAFIGGGAIVRSLLGTDIFKGDIDIFSTTHEALFTLIDRYKKDKTWEKSQYAYNLKFQMGLRETKLQIINRDAPIDTEDTLNRFDFEHCKFGIRTLPIGIRVISTAPAPVCLAKKELKLSYIRNPTHSLGRAIKYKRLGFDADKAIEQLVAMSIKDMKDVQCCSDGVTFDDTTLDGLIASTSS